MSIKNECLYELLSIFSIKGYMRFLFSYSFHYLGALQKGEEHATVAGKRGDETKRNVMGPGKRRIIKNEHETRQ